METLDYLILGPFQVIGQEPLAIGGPRQRAVLALLLLNRREVVATDRMIDELWGEHPPATVGKAIQVYISNLRKILGDGALLTSDGGYRLEVERTQVDADRFDGLVARGRTALERGYPAMARDRLREALALWRGRPLADFSYHQFAQAEIARLEEARIAALEDRIEAELALGAHSALVPELETHVRAHPTRERLWGQLMLALYRSGRQADALERYRRARDMLNSEFAIEPGRELKDLERAILTQDPALDAPALEEGVRQIRVPSMPDRTSAAPSAPPADIAGDPQPTSDPAGPMSSDVRDDAASASQRAEPMSRTDVLRSRVTDWRRAIASPWRERRIAIAAGVLLTAAVIVIVVLTSVGGSNRRAAHPQPAGCAGCIAMISAPQSGRLYTVGRSVSTTFSCFDGARSRPIMSCDDSTGSDTKTGGHGRLDTSAPGFHTYTVTLTLSGGATKTARLSYRVFAPLAASIAAAIARVSRRHARISLSCSGGRPQARCSGITELELRRLTAGHISWARIARARYAASAGTSRVVVLRLSRVGMRALRHAAGHHRRAKLITTLAGASPTQKMIRLQLS